MRSVLVLAALRFTLVLLMTLIDCTATSYRSRKVGGGVASERR